MNLLAYGGTSLVFRHRIGKWPDGMDGILQDLTGLPHTDPALGAGRLDDRCILIARQRQNLSNRGGYAFTLLLDPGIAVWRAWGWNAPRLLGAMFTPGAGPAAELLIAPERFGAEELQALFAGLKPLPAARPEARDLARLRVLWVRGATAAAPAFFLCDSLGFAGRAPMETLAEAVDGLPPCFRFGGGFLSGGDTYQAKVWGVNLVLDTETPRGVTAESAPASNPDWDAWQLLAARPELARALEPWSSKPIWEWTDDSGLVMERIRKLAALIRGGIDDQDLDTFCNPSWSQGPLGTEIQTLAAQTITMRPGLLSESATRYLLTRSLDFGLIVNGEAGARMDEVTLASCLRQRAMNLWSMPGHFSLPLEKRCEVAAVALATASIEEVPTLLMGFLRAFRQDLSERQIVELAKAAVPRAPEREKDLHGWVPLRFDRPVWQVIENRFCAIATQRAEHQDSNWAHDYLIFGGPQTGFPIPVSGGMPESIGSALVDLLRAEDDEFRRLGRQWLKALASSPLRRELAVETKRRLAEKAENDSSWLPFLVLCKLFDGIEPSMLPPIDASERAFLALEFDGLVRRKQLLGAPLLVDIVNWLGQPGSSTVTGLEQLEPPNTNARAFSKWVEGARQLGLKTATKESIRMAVSGEPERVPENLGEQFALLLFSPAERRQDAVAAEEPADGAAGKPLLQRMRGGLRAMRPALEEPRTPDTDPAEETRLRGDLRQILGLCRFAEGRAALNRAVLVHSEAGGDVFAGRYGSHRTWLDSLMRHLEPDAQSALVACLACHSMVTFAEDCQRLVTLLNDMETDADLPSESPHYDGVLIRYLLERGNRRLADSMAGASAVTGAEFQKMLSTAAERLAHNGRPS